MTPQEFEAALTKEEADKVLRIAQRLDFVNGEDTAQDSLLTAWIGCDKFQGQSQLSTWLYSVTMNTGLNNLKKRTRYRNRVIADGAIHVDLAVTDDTPHKHLEADRKLNALNDALSLMKPAKRNAWMMYNTTPAEYKEMPSVVGGTAGSNKSRVSRANDALLSL